jgi:hypothetical protein
MTTFPLTPDAYRPFLNEDFVLRGAAGVSMVASLHAVNLRRDNDDQLSFSLWFRPPAGGPPPPREAQGTYRLSHPRLGEFDLFLVPIIARRGVVLFEAVFNLLKDEAQ